MENSEKMKTALQNIQIQFKQFKKVKLVPSLQARCHHLIEIIKLMSDVTHFLKEPKYINLVESVSKDLTHNVIKRCITTTFCRCIFDFEDQPPLFTENSERESDSERAYHSSMVFLSGYQGDSDPLDLLVKTLIIVKDKFTGNDKE
jgi:hypothetical protein